MKKKKYVSKKSLKVFGMILSLCICLLSFPLSVSASFEDPNYDNMLEELSTRPDIYPLFVEAWEMPYHNAFIGIVPNKSCRLIVLGSTEQPYILEDDTLYYSQKSEHVFYQFTFSYNSVQHNYYFTSRNGSNDFVTVYGDNGATEFVTPNPSRVGGKYGDNIVPGNSYTYASGTKLYTVTDLETLSNKKTYPSYEKNPNVSPNLNGDDFTNPTSLGQGIGVNGDGGGFSNGETENLYIGVGDSELSFDMSPVQLLISSITNSSDNPPDLTIPMFGKNVTIIDVSVWQDVLHIVRPFLQFAMTIGFLFFAFRLFLSFFHAKDLTGGAS